MLHLTFGPVSTAKSLVKKASFKNQKLKIKNPVLFFRNRDLEGNPKKPQALGKQV